MDNSAYLQKFRNLEDITVSLSGTIHDEEIDVLVVKEKNGIDDPRDPSLSVSEHQSIQDDALDMYLYLVFIQHADAIRYARLQDELKNDFTKGIDNYPKPWQSRYNS